MTPPFSLAQRMPVMRLEQSRNALSNNLIYPQTPTTAAVLNVLLMQSVKKEAIEALYTAGKGSLTPCFSSSMNTKQ